MIFGKARGLHEFTAEEQRESTRLLGPIYESDLDGHRILEFIDRLERADQGQWIVQHWLYEFNMQAKRYVQALQATKQMIMVDPLDPRSNYAAAEMYRLLTHAIWVHPLLPDMIPALKGMLRQAGEDPELLDPHASHAALESLNMPIEEAYECALKGYQRTLEGKLTRTDRKQVEKSMGVLRDSVGRFLPMLRKQEQSI